MGQLIGGVLAIFLLDALFDWALFKRVIEPGPVRIAASVSASVVLAIVLYGFGNANGGPWNPGSGIIAYPFGGVVVGAFRFFRLKKSYGDTVE